MKPTASAVEIAQAVKGGSTSARAEVASAIGRIEAFNGRLGAVTDLIGERAMARATEIDAQVAAGKGGALAGVPFGVANLFDIEGIATRAGSKINREMKPARTDATLVTRLEAAGAICVGALNMGEYASDFTGGNPHDGPSHNPHDLGRIAGGASGGSAAAVAAGLMPLSIGIDSNGSVRVPASLCGLFALKPTFGRLSRHGAFLLSASFDHPGLLGRNVTDIAHAYDALQGFDEADAAMNKRPIEPVIGKVDRGAAGYRIAIADGYFAGDADARDVIARVGTALSVLRTVSIADAQAARAAALIITMAEGGAQHLERLRTRSDDFDPEVRDRLLAGAMLPAAWVERAQRFRRKFRDEVLKLFSDVDAIIVPATPLRAPEIGQRTALMGGVQMPVRPNLGIFTQPISFIGLPVAVVPVWIEGQELPLGVQIIAPPWREDVVMRIARQLEVEGVVKAPVAKGFAEE